MPGSSPGMTSGFGGASVGSASHRSRLHFQTTALFSDTRSRPAARCDAPESLHFIFRPKEGVGNAGCPLHPRPRVHLVVVERTRVTTSTPESPDVPARNGFNGFLRALPGDRACLPPSSADMSCLSPVGPT